MVKVGGATQTFFLDQFGAATLRGAVERAAALCRPRQFAGMPGYDARLTDLKRILEDRRIRLGADIANKGCGEGLLVPDGAGFVVHLRSGAPKVRQRFSLAHEIGHSLFYRVVEAQQQHRIASEREEERAAEEYICDCFARTLLLPLEAVRTGLAVRSSDNPWSVVHRIEMLTRRFKVSSATLLARLGDVQAPDAPFVVLCMRLARNKVTGLDERLRVVNSHTFIRQGSVPWAWSNQSALSLRLDGAVELWRAWQTVQPDKSRTGRFALDSENSLVPVRSVRMPCSREQLAVSVKTGRRWNRQVVPAESAHCLYAPSANAQDAFMISVVRVTSV